MTGWIDRRGAVGFGLAIVFGMGFFSPSSAAKNPTCR